MSLTEIESQFDDQVTRFFALGKNLVQEKQAFSLLKRDDKAQIARLTEFIRSYGDCKNGGGEGEIKDFYLDLFSGLYRSKKREILNSRIGKSISWLNGETIVLSLGSNFGDPDPNTAMPISFLYTYSDFIQKEYTKRATENPSAYGADTVNGWKLQLNHTFQRMLLGIFLLTDAHLESSEQEQQDLESLARALDTVMGVSKTGSGNPLEELYKSVFGDVSTDKLLEQAPEYMDAVRQALPAQVREQLPTTSVMAESLSETMSNERLMNTLISMRDTSVTAIENSRRPDGTIDYMTVIGGVMSTVFDTEHGNLQVLGDAMNGIAAKLAPEMGQIAPGAIPSALPQIQAPGTVPTIPGLVQSQSVPLMMSQTSEVKEVKEEKEVKEVKEEKELEDEDDDDEIPFV
jgi:hypothetical protein